MIRNRIATMLAGVSMIVGLSLVAGCSGQGDDAKAFVAPYLDALAAGDAAAAHAANPYSPILSAEGLAASAAGQHVRIVDVGAFEEAADKLVDKVPIPETTPAAGGDWWGVDWSKDDWTGLGAPEDALADADGKVTQGVVPVTLAVGDETVTVPLGVAFGRLENGSTAHAFRAVSLTEEQQAKFGVAKAAPAVAPAAVLLATSDADAETAGADPTGTPTATAEGTTPAETDTSSWWEKAKERIGTTTKAGVTRAATISGAPVTLSTETPLVVLPGVYDVAVPEAGGDALWAAPGAVQPASVVLAPGGAHQVTLGVPEVTPAGKAAAQTALDDLANAKFEAMVAFPASDRERACGLLAPGVFGGSKFEDNEFTLDNTNIGAGAVTVVAKSKNGATKTLAGNGTAAGTLADEAFCAGRASLAGAYTSQVKVESSKLTAGTVAIGADGKLKTATPWILEMATRVANVDTYDAVSVFVPAGVKTTYTSTVRIEWRPSGVFDRDGVVHVART